MNEGPERRQVIDLVSDEEFLSDYDNSEDSGNEAGALPLLGLGGPEIEGDWDERGWGGLDVEGAAPPDPLEQDWERDFIDFDPIDQLDLAPAVNRPQPPQVVQPNVMDNGADLADGDLVTAAVCLQMVLDILPDISVDYVLALITEQTQDNTRTPDACQRIITQILDSDAYPKEHEEASRKRKRQRSLSEFEDDDGEGRSQSYTNDV